jgi:hypothetical protein
MIILQRKRKEPILIRFDEYTLEQVIGRPPSADCRGRRWKEGDEFQPRRAGDPPGQQPLAARAPRIGLAHRSRWMDPAPYRPGHPANVGKNCAGARELPIEQPPSYRLQQGASFL